MSSVRSRVFGEDCGPGQTEYLKKVLTRKIDEIWRNS